jgi:hypothetical protein
MRPTGPNTQPVANYDQPEDPEAKVCVCVCVWVGVCMYVCMYVRVCGCELSGNSQR